MGYLANVSPDDLDDTMARIREKAIDVSYRKEDDGTYTVVWDVPVSREGSGIRSTTSSSSGVVETKGE